MRQQQPAGPIPETAEQWKEYLLNCAGFLGEAAISVAECAGGVSVQTQHVTTVVSGRTLECFAGTVRSVLVGIERGSWSENEAAESMPFYVRRLKWAESEPERSEREPKVTEEVAGSDASGAKAEESQTEETKRVKKRQKEKERRKRRRQRLAEETAAAAGGTGATEHKRDAEELTGDDKEDAEGAITDLGARAGYGQQAWNGEAVAVATEQSGQGVDAVVVAVVAEDHTKEVTGVTSAPEKQSQQVMESTMQTVAAEIEYVQPDNSAQGSDSLVQCNGEAEKTEHEETTADDMAMVDYCIQLAVEEDAEKAAAEDWDEVLGAVEMAQKAELAEIKWTADAEVNQWMAAVETAVEVSNSTEETQ